MAFRAVDKDNYGHFYLRPFVSDYPDAGQYTPVFHGATGCQLYSGPRRQSWQRVIAAAGAELIRLSPSRSRSE